jgi:IS30 family transposase
MSYHHLTTFERGIIGALHNEGLSSRQIAAEISRHHSTIARELSRNQSVSRYSPETAHRLYSERRVNCRNEGKYTPSLGSLIEEKLRETWSPEQIVGRLLDGQISFKTIYRWIYKKILVVDIVNSLRQKGKRRKPQETRGQLAVGRTIHDREVVVNERKEFGHWELDSVVSGRGKSKGCLATFLERKSRFYFAILMPNRTAHSMQKAIETLCKLFPNAVKSFTVDRGKEFACWPYVEMFLKIPVYFADPYSSWQRGSNENANGLIREFFPKASDLSLVTPDQVQHAIDCIVNRPRKILGWKTAYEVFMSELSHLA